MCYLIKIKQSKHEVLNMKLQFPDTRPSKSLSIPLTSSSFFVAIFRIKKYFRTDQGGYFTNFMSSLLAFESVAH